MSKDICLIEAMPNSDYTDPVHLELCLSDYINQSVTVVKNSTNKIIKISNILVTFRVTIKASLGSNIPNQYC